MSSDGRQMHDLIAELYPICRSITGNGVRETLARVGREIPLDVVEAPSGTTVFDWVVPREWNIRGATIRDPAGNKILDLEDHSLHVLSYSAAIDETVSLEELKAHTFTLPDRPDWIPYRTSYYEERWGFCMPHRLLESLPEGEYHVSIDATLEPGNLTYGECFLPGASEEEILISTHVCHPSMCNDNLSGVAVATWLARHAAQQDRRHSFRFLFIPGTIGSITWLSRNRKSVSRIRHGLVLAGLGDAGLPHYKRSRQGNAAIDRTVERVLQASAGGFEIEDFSPYGYDERQYCSPGFDLPVGCFSRTPHGRYPEYHTSADDLSFVSAGSLQDSFRLLVEVLDALEHEPRYVNLNPRCEPQLGKRGLYDSIGGRQIDPDGHMALLWMLNQSDGSRSLPDVAKRSGLSLQSLRQAAEALVDAGLLEAVPGGADTTDPDA